MTITNPHRHISKTLMFYYSEQGQLKLLAQDRRIRNKAERLGLRAERSRQDGLLTLTCGWSGTIQHGPGLSNDEAENHLNRLIVARKAATHG